MIHSLLSFFCFTLILFLSSSCLSPQKDFKKEAFYGEEQGPYRSAYVDRESLPRGAVSSAHQAVLYPEVKRNYQAKNRMTQEDFLDQNPEEGSLWASGGQTNYYFTRNFIRSVGESIQIQIDKNLYQDIGIEVKKTLGILEAEKEIQSVQNSLQSEIQKLFLGLEKKRSEVDQIKLTAAAPAKGSQAPMPDSNLEEEKKKHAELGAKLTEWSEFERGTILQIQKLNEKIESTRLVDVDIEASLSYKEGDMIPGQILGRDASGNYKIRALKKIPYRYGSDRIVSVFGVIRSTDIGKEGDLIPSGKLYEYRVDVSH